MRGTYFWIIGVCSIFIFFLTCLPTAVADAYREVGVWWVNNFDGTDDDLNSADDEAEGLYDKLDDEGWTTRCDYGNSSARETHWDGASNDSYIDNCDIVMIATHGSSDYDSGWGKTLTSIVFSDGSSNTHMHPSEAYLLWGDEDLEWAGLFCCSVLRDSTRKYWYRTMDHLRLLCGFTTTAYGSTITSQGKRWGKYMIDDGCCDSAETVTQSWFHATDYTQPHGVTARVIAEDDNNYDDYLWGQGYQSSDYSHDGHYWYWDHDAACKLPLSVSGLEAMTLYKVLDDPVDQQKAEDLAGKFGFQCKVAQGADGKFSCSDGTRKLEIEESGAYYYANLSKLWVLPDEAPDLPTESDAIAAAENFFNTAGLMPQDVGAVEVGVEKVIEMNDDEGSDAETEISKIEIMRWAYFPRELYDSPGDDTFSVVGPGAKMKAYIGQGGEVLGAMGGWRAVEPVMQISIFSQDEANRLLGQHGRKICLLDAPMYDTFDPEYTTLCYFEHQADAHQMFLVPIYMMKGTFKVKGEAVHEGSLYVPAAYEFLPPVPTITSPEDNSVFDPGGWGALSAEVQFGYGKVKLEWWSDIDGFLGTGPTINAHLTARQQGSEPVKNTITVVATDQKGDRSEDTISLVSSAEQLDPWIRVWLAEEQDADYEPYTTTGGQQVVLMLSAGNPGPGKGVELYLCLLCPGGRMLFFPNWASVVSPVRFDLPENFEVGPIPFVRTKLPSLKPPISQVGDYCFMAWLADHSNQRIIGQMSKASFNVDQ